MSDDPGADRWDIARDLLDSGPDLAVEDFMVMFMRWGAIEGVTHYEQGGRDLFRVTDGQRTQIYEIVEYLEPRYRLRWPD